MNSRQMDQPSMQAWQEAWSNADSEQFARCYAADGVVMPPNHDRIKGASDIVNFFKGGMASIHVRFFPNEVVVADTLAYEAGLVRDFERHSEAVVETCHYAVTYILEGGAWKIKFHTWTIPIQE